MTRLTRKTIDAIKPDAKKDVFVWDDKLAGFGLRVKPSGTKSFLLQYRNERGKSKRMTIGKYGKLTPDQARKEAIRLLGSVELGSDPAAQREEARHEWTIKQLCGEYLKQALAGNILTRKGEKKAASTLATDKGRVERHIIPLLGSCVVKDITRQQIMKFYTDVKSGRTATDVVTGVRGRAIVTGGQGTAKRTVGLLSGILSYAIDLSIIQINPAHGVKLPADKKRSITNVDDKYKALGTALRLAGDGKEIWQSILAIKLIAFTGMRRGEALALTWKEVDFEKRYIRLMTSKTGASVRPLGQEAIEVLQQIKHISLPGIFVFPSVRSSGGTFGGFPRAWKRITTNSGLSKEELQALSEISAHSLRHGFATIANDIGLTLPTVSSLLGHSLGGVTAGYVSQIDATLVAAADKTCRAISIKLGSSNHDNVIEYRAFGKS